MNRAAVLHDLMVDYLDAARDAALIGDFAGMRQANVNSLLIMELARQEQETPTDVVDQTHYETCEATIPFVPSYGPEQTLTCYRERGHDGLHAAKHPTMMATAVNW